MTVLTNEPDGLLLQDVCYESDGSEIIHSISLRSDVYRCTGLVGLNGAGKTTLLKLCHGLLPCTRGRIFWGDKEPRQLRSLISMVFQHPCLLNRSVYANLDYVLSLRKLPRGQRTTLIEEALALVQLQHLARRQAKSLSGGEQQRLVIARVWLCQPRIVLLDEPTGWLDLLSKQIVEQLIQTWKQAGVRIVFSSHDLDQVRRLSDDVIFLDRSKCIKHLPAADFFSMFPSGEALCAYIDTCL